MNNDDDNDDDENGHVTPHPPTRPTDDLHDGSDMVNVAKPKSFLL